MTAVLNNIVRAFFVFISTVCIRYSVYLHFNGASHTLLAPFPNI